MDEKDSRSLQDKITQVEKALADKDGILWSTFQADALNLLGSCFNQVFDAQNSRELGYMQGKRDALNWVANYVKMLEARLDELKEEALSPEEDDD